MHKNDYISREEQKVWDPLREKDIIDTELAAMVFPEMNKNKINKIFHSLYKKGYIKRAIRNIYYIPENLDSYYKLALRIGDGYIGLISALKYHGLIPYEDFTIYVITRKKYREIELDNYKLKYMPSEHYEEYETIGDIKVSTPEKTFFDCLLRMKYLNYSLLTEAIYNCNIRWKYLIGIFRKGPMSLRQKAGYILEMLKEETGFRVPGYVLEELGKDIKTPVKLKKGMESEYNNKWKVQDTIGKRKILSWWFQ